MRSVSLDLDDTLPITDLDVDVATGIGLLDAVLAMIGAALGLDALPPSPAPKEGTGG